MATSARQLLGGALLLAGCQALPTAPTLALNPCTPIGEEHPLLCGNLTVPEQRGAKSGRTIELNVWVIPATGEKTLPPLYDLPGGPGVPATGAAGFYTTDGAAYHQNRDIVLMDQRGTGQSAPLKCPELAFSDPLQPVLDVQAVSRCREQLSAIANLSAYSTAESVADLDQLRAALGHERVDLVALSYGTRVAQEYLRAYPDRIRTVVLMGALSPDQRLPLPYSVAAQSVLDELARDCAADAACHKAIPDLSGDIRRVDQRLVAGSVKATGPNGRRVGVQAGPFWQAVRAQLVATDSQRRLPWLLHQAADGRFKPILDALKPRGGGEDADGMLLSVMCPEDTLHITAAEIDAVPATVFRTYRQAQQMAACRAWGVAATATTREFVRAQTPVLLMAGARDHVTPPQWAHDIARFLPNARVVQVPYLGHSPEGLSNMACYDSIIQQFLDAGSASGLDVGCSPSMQPPAFTLK